jgi:hypothetical protein
MFKYTITLLANLKQVLPRDVIFHNMARELYLTGADSEEVC